MTRDLTDRRVLVLGGTGSLGQRLFHRLLEGGLGVPESITVLSRDEAKQHYMRLEFLEMAAATDDVIYSESRNRVRWVIGDVRNFDDVRSAVSRADVIFHAAAMKQVPTCEYFGEAAVHTNVLGAINLTKAIEVCGDVERTVVGISTDKACKPVNLMGMTKAIQERILVQGNLASPSCRFVNVRYGNVMASRGSAIPFFIDLVRRKKPIPITDWRMTRFMMTLDQSVDLVFNAYRLGRRGETWLPMVPSALVSDMARAVAEDADYPLELTGIRPGEKIHEILVSEEEIGHTVLRGENLVIQPILPELREDVEGSEPYPFPTEYSSSLDNLSPDGVLDLLRRSDLTIASDGRAARAFAS